MVFAAQSSSEGNSSIGLLPLTDFNHLLHSLRTANLRQIQRPVGVLLSAGCAGRWYFDWLEETCGPISSHLGIEFYSPRPDDLPPNTSWIVNTVNDMSEVPSGSVNVVFSGQNIEHLWPAEVAGFLLEAHRVLAPGGRLVLDSPNRLMVELLGWAHPEHTVEFSPAEARDLVESAGFRVDVCRGLWQVYNNEAILPLMVGTPRVELVIDRALAAVNDPDHAFVWWIEATKARDPVVPEVAKAADRLFADHWAERVWRGAASGTRSAPFPLSKGEWRIDGSGLSLDGLDPTMVEITPVAGGLILKVERTQFGVTLHSPNGRAVPWMVLEES